MQLSAAHWVYLAGVVVILATMIARKNIVVPAVAATFLTALVHSGNVITGTTAVFNASLVAATNLFNIFLIIALVTAMLHSLQVLGADRLMVAPFRRVMRNGHMAFWALVVITYFMSLFFWPTPAVPLIGAVLVPVAIRAGLRPMAVGLVIACAGQGMALSSDYVIRVAGGLSAQAGGLDANAVTDKAMVLSLVVGGVALLIGYAMEFRKMRAPSARLLTEWEAAAEDGTVREAAAPREGAEERELVEATAGTATATLPPAPAGGEATGETRQGREALPGPTRGGGTPPDGVAEHPAAATLFAVLVPLAYLGLIGYLVVAKMSESVPDLQAGQAAGLVGGVAALIVLLASLVGDGKGFLESSATHVVDGLVFAFKAMGIVLPIAGFFFIGNGEFASQILGTDEQEQGILFDLVTSAQQYIPDSPFVAAFGILVVGVIAGLDGSGFSGLPLTGALAGSLGDGAGMNAETLAALGQMGNIWSGGGTLVAWSSLIAVAGFARVPVLELARRCFLPVMCGLVVAAVFAVIVLG
ncbi:hypothetical protein SacmaDRAFT_2683 [Saccharomonospora marina XMU15]|uniref:Uncharacterized protein n=1 Tax=Saccharomonospora marina XMU15 TaxID=882083 RepID=H5X1R1_9PSEU|nr:membrane protein [Saccharomonospora marina]EHR50924.1 hypothetical protein SacmaDRAFT_2683 [Saccharomonospora marina XMU15]